MEPDNRLSRKWTELMGVIHPLVQGTCLDDPLSPKEAVSEHNALAALCEARYNEIERLTRQVAERMTSEDCLRGSSMTPAQPAPVEPETCPHCNGPLPNLDSAEKAIRHLRAENEALREQLRDIHQRAFDSDMDKVERVEALEARAEASEARCAALLGDLRYYGRHRKGCTQTIEQVSEYACDCGLQRAINKASAAIAAGTPKQHDIDCQSLDHSMGVLPCDCSLSESKP